MIKGFARLFLEIDERNYALTIFTGEENGDKILPK